MRYDAVVFDLLTGLLDSWSLWNAVAGDAASGLRWRGEYLRLTYGAGAYRPYEEVVAEAAWNVGVDPASAAALVARWDELRPWPEARESLEAIGREVPLAVVTNCSESLGQRAAGLVGVPFSVVVTAERAGCYKPDPRAYRLALAELRVAPSRALFVAGSPGDVAGASAVGLPVAWHNRLGLPALGAGPAPLATLASLTPLPSLLADRA